MSNTTHTFTCCQVATDTLEVSEVLWSQGETSIQMKSLTGSASTILDREGVKKLRKALKKVAKGDEVAPSDEMYNVACVEVPVDSLRIARRLDDTNELWLGMYAVDFCLEAVFITLEDAKRLREVLKKFLKETKQL